MSGPNPKLPISPKTRIELAIEDGRTQEEKERDLQREIEKRIYPLPWVGPDEAEAVATEECKRIESE